MAVSAEVYRYKKPTVFLLQGKDTEVLTRDPFRYNDDRG